MPGSDPLGLPPLPGDALQAIADDVLAADEDRVAEFRWSGAVIRRWRDLLHAETARAPLPPDWSAAWDGLAPLPLPGGGQLALEPAMRWDVPLEARARAGGERIRQPGRDHSHELKHVLQDLGVPPWERGRLPLLFGTDGELLAAGDLVVSAHLQSWLDTHQARLRLTSAD